LWVYCNAWTRSCTVNVLVNVEVHYASGVAVYTW